MPSLDRRWQALVIDEGQDLEADWLLRLTYLLSDPDEDDLYVFHDPAQALYREDAVAILGLPEYELPENCRNSLPIHEFAYRWYTGELVAEALREDGREPRIVVAEPGSPTVEAVGSVLDELVKTEGVEPERIGVLTGGSVRDSGLWRRRRFHGGLILWNGSYDDAGESLGLSADEAPAQPPRTVRLESIHRSKGLEWDVVVLAELRPEDERLGMLLYIGASRAKHHLVVVAPADLARQLRARSKTAEPATPCLGARIRGPAMTSLLALRWSLPRRVDGRPVALSAVRRSRRPPLNSSARSPGKMTSSARVRSCRPRTSISPSTRSSARRQVGYLASRLPDGSSRTAYPTAPSIAMS